MAKVKINDFIEFNLKEDYPQFEDDINVIVTTAQLMGYSVNFADHKLSRVPIQNKEEKSIRMLGPGLKKINIFFTVDINDDLNNFSATFTRLDINKHIEIISMVGLPKILTIQDNFLKLTTGQLDVGTILKAIKIAL